MDWRPYLAKGLVKAQRPDRRQIERQLLRADKDLKTLGLVIRQDPEWAATMAYQAMLRLGRALMFSRGYLPADGQQHKTVVEATGKLLGRGSEVLVNRFDRMRRSRNVFFYDSLDAHDQAHARAALDAALKLSAAIKALLRENDPQGDLPV